MQAVIKMIRFLYKMTVRLAVLYLVFMLLAWLLLNEPFHNTWNMTTQRVNTFFAKVTGVSQETGSVAAQMGITATKQIDAAKDRFHGVDPYEGYNDKLAKDIKEAKSNQ